MHIIFFCTKLLKTFFFFLAQHLNREPVYGEIVGFKSTLTKNHVRGRVHKYLGGDLYSVKHMDDPFKENIRSCEMILLQFEHKIVCIFGNNLIYLYLCTLLIIYKVDIQIKLN